MKSNRHCFPSPFLRSRLKKARGSFSAFLSAGFSVLLVLSVSACKSEEPAKGASHCPELKVCFDECNQRFPPQHGSNEIEVCLNNCIQTHGNPEACPELGTRL